MQLIFPPETRARLQDALVMMKGALDILDEAAAPGGVGASLDLAINRLEARLGKDGEIPADSQATIAGLERAPAERPDLIAPPNPWPIQPV